MVAFVLGLIVLLLIATVCVLGLWGTTNAATALVLATTNAIEQATIAVLTCAIVAALPLGLCGAFTLGALWGERKHAHDATRVRVLPTLERDDGAVRALPHPKLTALPTPGVPATRWLRAPHHARASARRARQVAQRWFR